MPDTKIHTSEIEGLAEEISGWAEGVIMCRDCKNGRRPCGDAMEYLRNAITRWLPDSIEIVED